MAGIRMARLFPLFNAIADTDFGPTTSRKIRYTIAGFKAILARFINEYITDAGTWDGPVVAGLSMWSDGTYTGTSHAVGTGKALDPYNAYSLAGGGTVAPATGNVPNLPDFEDPGSGGAACPYIDGMGAPREDADLTEFAIGTFSFGFNLFSPAIEQTDWENATHVWLAFDITVDSRHSYSYRCNPSGVMGTVGGGPPINNNFLGIAYPGASATGFAIPATSSIALGDGSTEAYFWSPSAGGDRFLIDSLNTNNY